MARRRQSQEISTFLNTRIEQQQQIKKKSAKRGTESRGEEEEERKRERESRCRQELVIHIIDFLFGLLVAVDQVLPSWCRAGTARASTTLFFSVALSLRWHRPIFYDYDEDDELESLPSILAVFQLRKERKKERASESRNEARQDIAIYIL